MYIVPNKYFRYLLLTLTNLILFSCDSKKDNPTSSNFDRQVMLQNYADNFIKPSFIDLQSKTSVLQATVQTFAQTPSLSNLIEAQTAWENAYLSWQNSNAYNIGAAAEDGLRKSLVEEIGTFPASETMIEANIAANNTSLQDFNRANRGFLAIEYLLFDLKNDNQKILSNFTNPNRKNYLVAIVGNAKTQIDAVLNAWNGSYRAEFINNTGKESGSSTSVLYNEFIKSYESIKNYKVSLPLGKRPGQTQIEPNKVEAYYSGKSIKMMREHFTNIENIWYGKNKNGVQGIGFKQYLASVEGGTALITATETQLAQVKIALAALPDSPRFSEQLSSNPAVIDNLNTELQKLTRFFKSDMSSLLGISITFMSSDGD